MNKNKIVISPINNRQELKSLALQKTKKSIY